VLPLSTTQARAATKQPRVCCAWPGRFATPTQVAFRQSFCSGMEPRAATKHAPYASHKAVYPRISPQPCPVALVLTFGLLLATELRVPLSLSRIFLYTPGFIPLGFVSDASWNCCHLQSLPMLERTVEQLHPERSATIKRPTFPTTLFSNKREGKGAKLVEPWLKQDIEMPISREQGKYS
jgi:hypothetical protein